jgi:hypothetical protein
MSAANYRPTSLSTSFPKVFGRAIYIRLIEHLNICKILVKQKFGFRKYLATEDAIYKVIYKILNALNNKTVVGSIILALERTFDSVNHEILLIKLSHYGITGKAKSLFESYLKNRYQRVNNCCYLNCNTVPEWTKIKHGVPQASILGPLLFLLYVNDLPKAIEHKDTLIQFSDDTSILITSPNTTQLQNDFNFAFEQLNKWFDTNLLFLNFDKTYFIQFMNKSTYASDIYIKYGDKQISSTFNTKFLGLFVNDTLSWKTHIEFIMSKLNSACYALRSVKPYMSQNILKMIYYSYFYCLMTYCSEDIPQTM